MSERKKPLIPTKSGKSVVVIVPKSIRDERMYQAKKQKSEEQKQEEKEKKRLKQVDEQLAREKKIRKDKQDVATGKKHAIMVPGNDMEEIEVPSDDGDVETFEEAEQRNNGLSVLLSSESPVVKPLEATKVFDQDGVVKLCATVIYDLVQYLKSRDDEYAEASVADIKEAIGVDLSDSRNDGFRESLRDNPALTIAFPTDLESVWDGFKVQRKNPLCINNKKELEWLFTHRLPRGEFSANDGTTRLTITEEQLYGAYQGVGHHIDHLIAEHKMCKLSSGKSDHVFLPVVPGATASPSVCKLWHSIKVPASAEELEEKLLKNGVLSKELVERRKEKRLQEMRATSSTAQAKKEEAVQEKKRQKQMDKAYRRTGATLVRATTFGNLSDLLEEEEY